MALKKSEIFDFWPFFFEFIIFSQNMHSHTKISVSLMRKDSEKLSC